MKWLPASEAISCFLYSGRLDRGGYEMPSKIVHCRGGLCIILARFWGGHRPPLQGNGWYQSFLLHATRHATAQSSSRSQSTPLEQKSRTSWNAEGSGSRLGN